MEAVKTWLPVFPGFYGTIFEPQEENEIYSINQERANNKLEPLKYDDIEFDYTQYYQDVCESVVELLESALIQHGVIESIKYECLSSPKEYNFYNDSIHVEIVPTEKLSQYINDNWSLFVDYIKGRYTSRSGFISFFSNDAEEWKKETDNFTCFGQHELGSCLEFVCQNERIDDEYLYYGMEAYLSCVDYQFEITKTKCPDCGEYYKITEIQDRYNKQVQYDLECVKDRCLKTPRVKPFIDWVKNVKHCEL